MSGHIVTARGNRSTSPHLVATTRVQRAGLVDLALRPPAVPSRTQSGATFHVWDQPVFDGDPASPRTWLQVGFDGGFGAALFYRDPRPAGERDPVTGKDWAWVALRPEPVPAPPTIYFDQDNSTRFPSRAVMPLIELREVVLEWVHTGQRPVRVEWLVVNALSWDLDDPTAYLRHLTEG